MLITSDESSGLRASPRGVIFILQVDKPFVLLVVVLRPGKSRLRACCDNSICCCCWADNKRSVVDGVVATAAAWAAAAAWTAWIACNCCWCCWCCWLSAAASFKDSYGSVHKRLAAGEFSWSCCCCCEDCWTRCRASISKCEERFDELLGAGRFLEVRVAVAAASVCDASSEAMYARNKKINKISLSMRIVDTLENGAHTWRRSRRRFSHLVDKWQLLLCRILLLLCVHH